MKALLLLLLICGLSGAEFSERLGLDPALRGLWMLHGVRNGDGPYEPADPPEEFAVARATSLTFNNGNRVMITRVDIYTPERGRPSNVAELENGLLLLISHTDLHGIFRVDLIEGETTISVLLISVE